MNQTTIEEVTRLLNDATYGRDSGKYDHEQRMRFLLDSRNEGQLSLMEYAQLVDALNTQLETGGYEGCIIWRNAEANPPPDTLYERRFSDGDQQHEDNEANHNRTEENGRERRAEFRRRNNG